jgi:hypothetical protein
MWNDKKKTGKRMQKDAKGMYQLVVLKDSDTVKDPT